MNLLVSLLMGCGSPADPPTAQAPDVVAPEPAPAGPAVDPMADACKHVITANDATAMYQVGRGLKDQGSCKFEDVKVEGSTVKIAFDTADGKKAWSTLQPSLCVDEPGEGAVVKDPWVLQIPAESTAMCPEGYKALVAAVVTGKLPPPSPAK